MVPTVETTDALIVHGFAHGTQWLTPGVLVRAPADTVRVWVQAGLAQAAVGAGLMEVATPVDTTAPADLAAPEPPPTKRRRA